MYNYVSSPENPITWEEFSEVNFIIGRHYPPLAALWIPIMILTKNPFTYTLLKIFLHFIPAIILDVGLLLTMNRPRYVERLT